METMINENVDVLARTYKGQIAPVMVSWKGKNYTVQSVESRKKLRSKRKRFESITVKVVVAREMQLEFDHASKSWRLLAIAQPAER
jgi:hypothetical protein